MIKWEAITETCWMSEDCSMVVEPDNAWRGGGYVLREHGRRIKNFEDHEEAKRWADDWTAGKVYP